MSNIRKLDRPSRDRNAPPRLRVVSDRRDPRIVMKLSFRELVLIHRSLEAVRTLGALERQDELLNDTIHLIDQALIDAA
jgi:hypothetical protein